MVSDWGVRENQELIAEMIVTALRMGSDAVPVADLKLINRSLKELRQAAKVFAPYQGIRKVAVFGSARTGAEAPEFQAAEAFSARMRDLGYMIITGGGDGIMGAAQRGAGRENSFGLNIRLPFEQRDRLAEWLRALKPVVGFKEKQPAALGEPFQSHRAAAINPFAK